MTKSNSARSYSACPSFLETQASLSLESLAAPLPKSKTSDFGESFQFTGNFEATRLSDNATFRASRLFLPKVIENLMADALQSSDEAIDFIVEIGVKFSKNAHHYEWSVKSLMESTQADQLAHLRATATAGLPALPAPEIEPVENKKTRK